MKDDPQWGRRAFLRLSVQAAGALGLGQAAGGIGSVGAGVGATATTHADRAENALVLTADTPWIISGKEPEPIQRALQDVQRDWYKVFGHVPVILSALPQGWRGTVVCFGLQAGTSNPRLSVAPGRECFALGVQTLDGGSKAVVAAGGDVRGTIYAVYAFSEQILGVDPWWYWTDMEPIPRKNIEVRADFVHQIGPATFKYRGWFINDEDLLSGFSADPLRENVFSLEMLDCICETLLRLRGNMLVPATFAFPDERCHELVARRGLALGMHHADVVGLNVNRWPQDVPFSYSRHPEIMERYWRQCIEVLKDKEVIWAVGYRGKGDQPFWVDEPGFESEQARGALITRAIAKQVALIREVQPDAAIATYMWWEGATLYHKGLIKIPRGVTLVWADNGGGFTRDNGQVQAGQGMYYHTMMDDSMANQLSELVPPARIYHEVRRFVRAGATEFFLVNVSDIRPVPLSTDCAMKLVCDARPYLARSDEGNQSAFLLAWSRRQFGPSAAATVARLCHDYFSALSQEPHVALVDTLDTQEGDPDLDDQLGVQEGFGSVPPGDSAPHFYVQWLCRKALPSMRKGQPLSSAVLAKAATQLEFAAANCGRFSQLFAKAKAVIGKIPTHRRDFYLSNHVTAVGIHWYSNEMLRRCCLGLQQWADGAAAGAAHDFERALQATEALFAVLREGQRGKWTTWYIGESLVGLEKSRDLIRLSLAAARAEPPPPIRSPREYSFYQYQERFKQNFPRLYGR